MKRKIAILLTLLMLAPTFASCSNSGTSNTDSQAENTATAETTADETVQEEEEDANAALFAALPTGNYDGYTFNILNNTSNFANTQVSADELTGEVINDAIYNRNLKVEELLNIKITAETVSYDKVTSTMNTAIPAGDDAYQIFFNESKFVAPFAVKGYLLDVNQLGEIDTTNPWWNTSVLNQLTFSNHLYFLVGDVHLMFNEAYWGMAFNRTMLNNLGLTDPYEQVREGTWTLDELYNGMAAATVDLNGNGECDADDQFGLACYNGIVLPLIFGTGVELVEDDGSGNLTFVISEQLLNSYEKVENLFKDTSMICADAFHDISVYKTEYDPYHGAFMSGHALYYSDCIGSLKKFRDVDFEFGIVPYPKYDESQENYVSYIASYAAFCGLPITNSDASRTATILENLCAYSSTDLKEAYRTTTVEFKYVQDEESIEMLDLILSTGEIRISEVLDCSSVSGVLQTNAFNGVDSVTSQLEKVLKVGNKTLSKAVTALNGTTEE